jgi:sugar lactone lactonase YvrE
MSISTSLNFHKYTNTFQHCESPVWDDRSEELFFVDIDSGSLVSITPAVGLNRIIDKDGLTSVSLTSSGGLVCGGLSSVHIYNASRTTFPFNLPRRTRLNEAKPDAFGRLWLASMDVHEVEPLGELFCLLPSGEIRRVVGELVVGNGIGWNAENTIMFLTDSVRGEIYQFDFDLLRGEISNKRLFAKIAPSIGLPDGLAVDASDGVWSAHFNGGRITRYLPNGEVDFCLALPVKSPTSLCFGGKEYRDLYVTTSCLDSAHGGDLASAVLQITTKFRGLPPHRFNDAKFSR